MSGQTSGGAVEILDRLVGIDSTSSRSNCPIFETIAETLQAPGITLESFPNETGQKIELLARLGPAVGKRKGLVLSGHMDTVPADEPDWDTDPLKLDDRNDRWVGRGTCDMKGFLALAIAAALRHRSRELAAPLVLLFTSDEELGSLGAQRLVGALDGVDLPRACVIGEPTSMKVVHRHKGHLRLRLTVTGKAAHSGFPHRGESAIEHAGAAIATLAQLRREWKSRTEGRDDGLEVPYVTLNIGTIRGGSAVNVIPASCELELGLRPLPGMLSSELEGEVRNCLAERLPDGLWKLETTNDSPSLHTDPAAEVHTTLQHRLAQTEPVGTSFASDGGSFQELGLESVLFGPGSIEVAHKPNEYLPKGEFFEAAVILDQMIEHFCIS